MMSLSINKTLNKNLLVVGPLPPPIHGESLAIESLITANKIKNCFNITVIDTSRGEIKKAGRFSIKKIIQDMINIYKVFKYAKTIKLDSVYISISQTRLGLLRDLIIVLLVRKNAKKIITHLHGNNLKNVITNLNKIEYIFAKKVLKEVDIGIALGKELVDNYLSLPKKTCVVTNGIRDFVDKSDFNDKKNENFSNSLKVLYLSNLIVSKGYTELINCVISLNKKGYAIELVLAGSIDNEENFRSTMEEVKKEQLTSSINYIGLVTGERKKELLLESDIMVLPTNYKIEGQPLSIIEGMAAGLPIISTKRGAIPDLVKENGILIDEGRQDLIEEALVTLLENKYIMEQMGKKSREYFECYYTIDKYIDNLYEILV